MSIYFLTELLWYQQKSGTASGFWSISPPRSHPLVVGRILLHGSQGDLCRLLKEAQERRRRRAGRWPPHTLAHLHIHGRGIGSSWYPSTDLLMISPFSSLLLISLHVLPIFPTCSKITFLLIFPPAGALSTPHSLYPRSSLDLLQSWRYQRKPSSDIHCCNQFCGSLN